jgi:hypothetical protein
VRLDIKDFDGKYVSGDATVSGTFYRESDSQVMGTINGTINDGRGRIRLPFDLNTDTSSNIGTGYIYSIDITFGGETSKEMGYIQSSWR